MCVFVRYDGVFVQEFGCLCALLRSIASNVYVLYDIMAFLSRNSCVCVNYILTCVQYVLYSMMAFRSMSLRVAVVHIIAW